MINMEDKVIQDDDDEPASPKASPRAAADVRCFPASPQPLAARTNVRD